MDSAVLMAWAREHLADDNGRPLELQPWQAELVVHVLEHDRMAITSTRRGGLLECGRLLAAIAAQGGVAVVEASRAQAEQVYAAATALAAGWPIPDWAVPPAEYGKNVSHCRSCNAEVLWVETKAPDRARAAVRPPPRRGRVVTAPVSARLVTWHAFTRDGLAHAFVPGAPRSLCGDIRRQPLIFAHPERSRHEACRDANARRERTPEGLGL